MKKRNWVRGFDRVAIVLAIPMAIFGTYYCPKKYAESKAVLVVLSNNEEIELGIYHKKKDPLYFLDPGLFGDSDKYGVIVEGINNLSQAGLDSAAHYALDRAIENGGDPDGSLVEWGKFGLKYGYFNDCVCLIPSKFKRYLVGAAGAISFFTVTILGIGLLTRLVPRFCCWLRDGFKG